MEAQLASGRLHGRRLRGAPVAASARPPRLRHNGRHLPRAQTQGELQLLHACSMLARKCTQPLPVHIMSYQHARRRSCACCAEPITEQQHAQPWAGCARLTSKVPATAAAA